MKLRNPEIRFETTNRCNYSCRICPREQMTRPQGTMSLELYKTLVVEGVKIGLKSVTLTSFGEPFLDKYFIERAKFAKKYNLSLFVDTNGYLVDETVSRELVAVGFDNIRFSIFATDAETYRILHGVNGYERVIRNIDRLLEIKRGEGSPLPKVGVYYIEQEENKNSTDAFIRYWENKVNEVDVWKAHNWINTFDFRKETLKRKKTCGRPISGPLQIRWNGEVSACCFDYNNELIMGDVSSGSYEDLFHDERYKGIQRAHQAGDLREYPLCLECDQLYDLPDSLVYSSNMRNRVNTSGNTFLQF